MDMFWHLLARTWSAAAFFHPLIQERGREWEKILTALLPEAEKVAVEPILSAGQREVLTRLLDTLQDPSTGLVSTIEENLSPKRRTEVVYETLPGNVAYVRVKHWFDFAISPGSFAQWDEVVQLVTGAVEAAVHEQASALVLDFRETTGTRAERHSEDRFIYGRLRTELISRLFERPISLPQLARVQRVGYHDPEELGRTVGGYTTEWVIQASSTPVMPGELVFTGPLFVLTGCETSAQLEPVLILLQQTGRAYCLGEQSQPYRAEEYLLSLTNEWKVRLRQHILFYHDHPIRYTPIS